MSETLSSISDKAGMSPGTLMHIGDVHEEATYITVVDYDKEVIEAQVVESVDDMLQYKEKETVTWINIDGLKSVELIGRIGGMFNIHPLVLEDILNTHQRPKLEEYEDYLYIVVKCLSMEEDGFSVTYEQVSILVFNNLVITFKEKKDELFKPLEKRLQNSQSRIRSHGQDYLAYAIIDTIVDRNFSLLDSLDVEVDAIEDELLTNPTSDTLIKIQKIKRELIDIRRVVSPLRELLGAILRSDTPLIDDKINLYFRDVYDHSIRIIEAIESYRDMLAGLLDIYISSVSNKMNEVMKVLTVFASIFIPLTFIAGIYGMNFEYMPELKWKWAYPTLWILFMVIPAVLLVYFKRKKWL